MPTLKRIKAGVSESILIAKVFGFKYGIGNFLDSAFRFGTYEDVLGIREYHYKNVRDYLRHNYARYIMPQKNRVDSHIQRDCPIWIIWWQGEKDMPELVRACYRSVQDNCGEHPVRLIDSHNFTHFVKLTEQQEELFTNGRLSITELSDIIRSLLLYQRGGIYLDSTIYMVAPFSDEIYSYPMYTVHHGKQGYLCNGLWTTFFWAAVPHLPFFQYLVEYQTAYWSNEAYSISYFIYDSMIKNLYQDYSDVAKILNRIPINNSHFSLLMENLSNPYKDWLKIKKSFPCTYIFKLSQKHQYPKKTTSGETTVYGQITSSL